MQLFALAPELLGPSLRIHEQAVSLLLYPLAGADVTVHDEVGDVPAVCVEHRCG
jgi:hypothetical protein